MKTYTAFESWAIIAFISLPLLGAGAGTPEKSSANASPPVVAKAPSTPNLDLDIVDGGFEDKPGNRVPATIANLAGWLREKAPGINLVLSPTAGEMTVNNLRLRSASVADFLQALNIATDGQVQGRPLGASERAYALMGRPHDSPPDRTVEVFNLSPYLRTIPMPAPAPNTSAPPAAEEKDRERRIFEAVENVSCIIKETSLNLERETGKKEEPLSIKFHPGANLLVVIGTPHQMAVAQKVVTALNPVTPAATELHK